ncbi:acyltransferase family protein [Sabulibacter ruber]|uniref:acyltransferase family protein n=1 Tax=Sabulibacter ruber TaxID=2811901 RepID=UPI001A970DEA|nr:acyltransferase [Sabulibacter ruber]
MPHTLEQVKDVAFVSGCDESSSKVASKRIIELDCTRGITAFLVVFVHYAHGTFLQEYTKILVGGTDLFFIISGFVGYNLMRSNPSLGDYLKRRFVRLVPIFWVCVTLTSTLVFIYHCRSGAPNGQLALDYMANLLMVNYFLNLPFIDGVYWTLLIEVLFYGLLGVLLCFGWVRHLEKIGAAILVFLLLSSVLPLGETQKDLWRYLGNFPLFFVWPAFYAGIVFNRIKYDGANFHRWCLVLLCIVANVALVGYSERIHIGVMKISPYAHGAMTFVYFTFFYLSIKNRLRFIVNKATLFLASISYCLYLTHFKIGEQFLRPKLHGIPGIWQIPLLVGAAVLLAVVLTYLVEVPLVANLSRRLRLSR